jgi:hypothetical protein
MWSQYRVEPPLISTQRRLLLLRFARGRATTARTCDAQPLNWPESTAGTAVTCRALVASSLRKIENAEMRDQDRVGTKSCSLDNDRVRDS